MWTRCLSVCSKKNSNSLLAIESSIVFCHKLKTVQEDHEHHQRTSKSKQNESIQETKIKSKIQSINFFEPKNLKSANQKVVPISLPKGETVSTVSAFEKRHAITSEDQFKNLPINNRDDDCKKTDDGFEVKINLDDVMLQAVEQVRIQLQQTNDDNVDTNRLWTEMKHRLIANKPRQALITSINFEAKLIHTIITRQYFHPQVLHSLRDYLLKSRINRNPYLQAQYCALLLHMGDASLSSEIDSLIETLLQDRRLLAHESRNYCIKLYSAISADHFTRVWNCVPVAERHRLNPIGDQLLTAALQFNLMNEAIELLQALPTQYISDVNVEQLIESLLRADPPVQQKQQFLDQLRQRRLMFRPQHRIALETLLSSMNFKQIQQVNIINERCDNCHTKLESVSKQEVAILSDCVLQLLRARVRTHNLNVSSDEEVQEFIRFLNDHHFDLVVDGLNIAHICSTNKIRRYENKEGFHYTKSPQLLEQSLITSLQALLTQFPSKHILIIGRHHMRQWKRLEKFVSKNDRYLKMYLVHNRSQDDLFTLFAALQHDQTFVLTGDILRQHHHKLDAKVESLFQKWISCRLSKPLREWNPGVDRVIHFNGTTCHLPINYSETDKDPSVRWLCAHSSHSRIR